MRKLVVRWARVSCARVCVRVSCGTRRSEKVALSERVASKSARAYPMLGGQWARGRLTHDACRDRTRSNRGGCLLKHASSRRPDRRIGEAGAYALFGYARASRQHVDGWCCTPARRSARTSGSECTAQARVRQAGLGAGAAHVATGAKATARQVEDAPDSCKGVRNAHVIK